MAGHVSVEKKFRLKDLPKIHIVVPKAKVHSEARFIENAGGMQNLSRHFKDDKPTSRLEYNFRPNAEFSHPIYGQKYQADGFLLEVTVKRRKRSKTQAVTNVQMVGRIENMTRFEKLADFQVFSSVQKSRKRKFSSLYHNDDHQLPLVPEVFARTARPQPISGGNPAPKRRGKTTIQVIDANDRVPTQAPPGYYERTKFKRDNPALVRLRELAHTKHIWDRSQLWFKTKHLMKDFKEFRVMLAAVFYQFKKGFFRHVLISLGFDPRLSSNKKESYRSQIIEFRINNATLAKSLQIKAQDDYSRAIKRGDREGSSSLKIRKQTNYEVPAGYTFQVPPQKLAQKYQLDLINDSKIKKILDNAVLVDKFDREKKGWLKKRTMDQIRNRMKEILEVFVVKIRKEGRQWVDKMKKKAEEEEKKSTAKVEGKWNEESESEDSNESGSDSSESESSDGEKQLSARLNELDQMFKT